MIVRILYVASTYALALVAVFIGYPMLGVLYAVRGIGRWLYRPNAVARQSAT